MAQQDFVPSPCIGKCGLDEREICRGCFRTINEIMTWEMMKADDRLLTIERCGERRAKRAARKKA